MPTQDNYTPYPVGLTAVNAVTGINYAYNLSLSAGTYQSYFDSSTPPTLAMGIKEQDIWHDTTNGFFYQVYMDATTNPITPLFFEV